MGSNFLAIGLDREFADECIAYKPDNLRIFVESVWEYTGNKDTMPSNFLDIYEGSLLPKGIHSGRNDMWLMLDLTTVDHPKDIWGTRPFMYHSRNGERMADQFWLLSTFHAWAHSASVLLKWF